MYFRAWLHRRCSTHVTYIGITGTAGKTTAKDLSAAMLSAFAPCQSTDETENAPFYVAQTIVSAGRRHRFCVVEVAASEKYNLGLSARLLKPDIAVLTLIAREHYSGFRSLEAIAAEKAKLIAALRPQGIAVLNIDDPLVRSIGERCNRRVIWVGKAEGATLRLRDARSQWPEPLTLKVDYEGKTFEVQTQLHGTQLGLPVLAALGVALAAGLPLEKAIAALAAAKPPEGRMQIVTSKDGVVFVRDDWKAPHWSMHAPLAFLQTARAQRKVAIIGSVSDSPDGPSKRYPRLARLALNVADVVIFVGDDALYALKAKPAEGKSLLAFAALRDASDYLRKELRDGDLVLLKGTNLQDHMARLILDRDEPVQCWRQRCDLTHFCGRCPRLYEPAAETSHAANRPLCKAETGF
jgi:UDP-N-acetylmuramyl pentapeptide synthase